jgi:hypothetical protein
MPDITIIEALKTYLAGYSNLKDDAPLWVDYLGPKPTQYAIAPLAGTKILEEYVDGSSLRAFPFAFQSMESTADELERLDTQGFYEVFADWLDTQTNAGTFPTLDSDKTPQAIETLGWSYLYREGESETGVYQIQCRLVFEQAAP